MNLELSNSSRFRQEDVGPEVAEAVQKSISERSLLNERLSLVFAQAPRKWVLVKNIWKVKAEGQEDIDVPGAPCCDSMSEGPTMFLVRFLCSRMASKVL